MSRPNPTESVAARVAASTPLAVPGLLFGLAGGLIVLSGCLVALVLVYVRAQTIEAGERLTVSLAHVIEEQSSRTLQTVDQRLQLAAEALSRLEAGGNLNPQSARLQLSDQARGLPFVRGFLVVSPQGRVTHDSADGRSEGLDLAESAFFRLYVSQPQTGFSVSIPTRASLSGRWTIAATRRLTGADGRFAGVLMAALDPGYFEKTWNTVDLPEGSSITLARRDGFLLVRAPRDESVFGKPFGDQPLFSQRLPASPAGSYQEPSTIDGALRSFAYRTLAAYPELVVVVGQSMERVLAPWRQLAALVLAVWALASGAIVLLGLFLNRQWQQRLRAQADVDLAAQRMTLATEAAAIAVWERDLHADLWYASPIFFTALGYPPQDGPIVRAQWLELLHPDDRELVLARVDAAQETHDKHYRYEARMRHADGFYRWFNVIGRVLARDAHGRPSRLLGVRLDVTAYKESEAALRDSAQQMQALSRRVLEVQEAERRRLAAELHDELGQSLTAIKIKLQARARFAERAPVALDAETIRIVDDALQQVRRVALALRPSVLDDLGLAPALRWMSEQNAERGGLAVRFESTLEHVRLAPEIETACFRIAQEALTNILRHARAGQVSIELREAGAELQLRIEDDGDGFDLAEMRQRARGGDSLGVLGMQERAALIGAQFEIRSTPGQGTLVSLRCALRLREGPST
jgi:PAS domain S-box-containing protein